MKKHFAATLAGCVLAGGLTMAPTADAGATPDFQPAPIDWGRCESKALRQAGAECGMLEVPLDYANPDGRKISLAVSRIEHSSPESEYQGAMLVNPGGPGGSGLGLSRLGQAIPNGVGKTYDWIGFDPRGVGSSEPALSCDPDYFSYDRPGYVPNTWQEERDWRRRSAEYAKACAKKNGPLLEHIKTTDNAKDIESLRKALGREKINYYGFSYGTYIGQVYSTMYPDRVRRIVMDGVVNPEDVWYQANLNQDLAFDRNIKIFFDWIAEHDSAYHLGNTGHAVEREYYRQLRRLDREPAGGVIGSAEWTDLFLSAGYSQSGWPTIADAFSTWVNKGDHKPLKALYDSANGAENGYAVYLATECTDNAWPKNWNRWRVDNWRTHFRAPFETWANGWYNAPCRNWPAKSGEPVEIDGTGVDNALLISQELDAATPYEGALEVRQRFPNSRLIGLPGGTVHSGSLSGNACVDDRIAAYLADGKLPDRKDGRKADVTCEPLPKPEPESQSSANSTNKKRSEPRPAVVSQALRLAPH